GSPITMDAAPNAIAVTPDQGPVASFTVTPAIAGSTTTFDASASTAPSSPIMSYAWTFGDGEGALSAHPTASHVYTTPGSYSVTLTLTDAAGTSSTQVFTGQTVSRNGGPHARS